MRSKKSFSAPDMYPKFSGVPRISALHARTSSALVSNARCTTTSTFSIASSLAPATTASVIAAVPPDREWNTTSSRDRSGFGRSAIANVSVLVDEARQVERQVLPHVAHVFDDDVPV